MTNTTKRDPAQQLAPIDAHQRYSIPESARYRRESRARLYEKIKAGEIETFLDGRRRYIHGAELIRSLRPPEETSSEKAA